jgi:hypothetical protein
VVYRSGIVLTILLLSITCCPAQVDQERDARKLEIDECIARLSALAADAQTFEPPLRSHIQTQVANLVWKFDRSFARDLFLKAWDAAESADREAGEKQQRDESSNVREARREVISAVWQRDHELGESLLAKLLQHDDENANSSSTAPVSSDELERLNVATQLLENGDPTEAAKLAGDVLNRAVIPSLRFLSRLREKNATAADELYVSLLARIVTDPAADANTVSLLSSYVFTPYVYLTIGSNGLPRIVQSTGETGSADVSPRIRLMFLDSAAQVLLRPTSNPAAQRLTYMVAIRLVPVFEQFNPRLATQIKSMINQLSPTIPSGVKNSEMVSRLRSGINNPDSNENIRDILNRAKQLTNASMRNQLYIRAAILAAGQGDRSATKILDEIDSDDLRDRVRSYVSILLAKHALTKKDLETALEFARSESLSPIERVWIYTEAVDLIKTKKSRGNVTDLLMQAVTLARRMDVADPNRTRALTGVAIQFLRYKRALAEQYLIEAVSAANKTDTLDSDDNVLVVRLETPVGDWSTFFKASNFSLKNLFRDLAKADFFQAINMSENLKSKETRSAATIAIAETVLIR